MRQLSQRERMELALLWALGLLLLYVLVLVPLFAAERMAASAERGALLAQNARIAEYQQLLLRDAHAEEKLRARHAHLMEALPEDVEQGTFMYAMERLAVRSGLVMEGFAPRAAEMVNGTLIQSIELRFRGNYFDVLSFLHAVQEGERCVAFDNFSFEAEGDALQCVLLVKIAARAADGAE